MAVNEVISGVYQRRALNDCEGQTGVRSIEDPDRADCSRE